MDEITADLRIYKVVFNDEEQYAIWLSTSMNPSGWYDAGKCGEKKECLDYIEKIWTDMRPLSLRRRMAELKPESIDFKMDGEQG
jgi:MbtH protein